LAPAITQPEEQKVEILPPQIKKALPFVMPKLKVEGLGFTDIIPDDKPT
jgi:hypothetical protein